MKESRNGGGAFLMDALESRTLLSHGIGHVGGGGGRGGFGGGYVDGTILFSQAPTTVKTGLDTLATADGVTGTISTTQKVVVYDEANGTKVYSVRLGVSKTKSNGKTYTQMISLAADQDGNPTVSPGQGGGCVYGGTGFDLGGGGGGGSLFGGSGFGGRGMRGFGRGWF